jgi:hypothetical protein
MDRRNPEGRDQVLRTLSLLSAAVLSLLFVALAACGGGGEEEGTGTPATPTTAGATQTAATPTGGGATQTPTRPAGGGATQAPATPTAAGATQTAATPTVATATAAATEVATEAAVPTPTLPSFSGGATATVTVGGETFTITGGKCDVASDGTWMAVNIGQAGSEYFGLLLQSNPAAPQGARPISGGAVYTDGEIALTVEHGGGSFLLGGLGAVGQASTVTLAADLKSGEFDGITGFTNQPMSGSFHC